MQLTSIQKLWKDIEKYGVVKDSQFVLNVPLRLLEEIFEKATESHKEEILDCYFKGAYDGDTISGEDYYEKTFKKD
jgi:hypothetical protein